MIVQVKIGEKTYQVAILDLSARPVRVEVDGEVIEVYPEEGAAAAVQPAPSTPAPPSRLQPAPANGSAPTIRAPIPGVILSVAVAPGDAVDAGQVLCVLEAMKMKNVLRAPRRGKVGRVLVQAGATVKHNDLLLVLED